MQQLFNRVNRSIAINHTSSSFSKISSRSISAVCSIDAELRSAQAEGSRGSRKYRTQEDKIPGIIYGAGNGKFPFAQTRKAVAMSRVDVQRHWTKLGRSIENTLFNVHVDDGTTYLVLPRQLQVHPVSENPISLNFLIYRPGSEVRVPIRYINEDDCIDIKRGAFVVPVTRFLSIAAEPGVSIPPFLDVDVSTFSKMKVITLSDIPLPPGVSVHRSVNQNIFVAGVIKGTGRA